VVPDLASLVRVTLHPQAFDAFGAITLRARRSNRLATAIGT
jgi:hypothetical protein